MQFVGLGLLPAVHHTPAQLLACQETKRLAAVAAARDVQGAVVVAAAASADHKMLRIKYASKVVDLGKTTSLTGLLFGDQYEPAAFA
jgi:hypothetical protein